MKEIALALALVSSTAAAGTFRTDLPSGVALVPAASWDAASRSPDDLLKVIDYWEGRKPGFFQPILFMVVGTPLVAGAGLAMQSFSNRTDLAPSEKSTYLFAGTAVLVAGTVLVTAGIVSLISRILERASINSTIFDLELQLQSARSSQPPAT